MALKSLNYLHTKIKRKDLVLMVGGNKKADLLIRGGNIVNVYTREIIKGDIAIYGDRIGTVGLDDVKAKRVIDAEGKFITPGLMDGHLHIDACLLSVTSFAKGILPHGTTAVFLDSHEIGNAMGVDGVKMMIEEGRNTPLRVFQYVPAQVPVGSEDLQTPNAKISLKETKELYQLDEVMGLGEVSKYRVVAGDPYFLEKIEWILGEGGAVDGSAHEEFGGRKLQAYVASGLYSDHESVSKETAWERARLGLNLMLREATSAHNLVPCLRAVIEGKIDTASFSFCTDAWSPASIIEKGHMNYAVKIAIAAGLDPVTAVQMGSLNCARNFGLDNELGGIAPGKVADFVIVDELREFAPEMVFVGGKMVAKDGKLTVKIPSFKYPPRFLTSVKISRKIKPEDLKIRVAKKNGTAKIRVIVRKEGVASGEAIVDMPISNGELLSRPSEDLIKIVCVERFGKTKGPNIGKGFVKEFGLKTGAIAESIGQDKQDLVAAGANDDDLALAINEVIRIQGGIVLADRGKILDTLRLPIGGIMTDEPVEVVASSLARMIKKAKSMGAKPEDPYSRLQYLIHPMLPGLRITDKGLVDVNQQKLVPLVLSIK